MPRAIPLAGLLIVLGGVAWAALREPEAPAPDRAGGTVVWAVGDAADGSSRSWRVARLVTRDRPEAVLYLGDVYEKGTLEDFREKLAAPYRAVLKRMLPTPGNHEWPRRRTGYDPFWKSVTGRRTRPWYSTRVAGWQIVSLNTEARHDAAAPQVRWARKHLRGGGTCRIAFWHHPRFNAGLHADAADVQPLWDAVKGRVALVLTGHDHNLQRFAPLDGVVQIVSGAGGRGLHEVREEDPRLEFADNSAYGGVRLTLHRERAEVEFVDAGGAVLDRSSVRCRRP